MDRYYGEGQQELSESITLTPQIFSINTLTGCFFYLILVSRGILYTGIVQLGDRLIHSPGKV